MSDQSDHCCPGLATDQFCWSSWWWDQGHFWHVHIVRGEKPPVACVAFSPIYKKKKKTHLTLGKKYLIQITKCFKDVTSYLHLKPVIVRLVQSAAVHSAS